MRKQTDIGKLIEEYCKQYPKIGDSPLAKRIYKEHGKLFKNTEHCRGFVRDYRGHRGKKSKKYARVPKPTTHDTTVYKPFKEEINPFAKILIIDIETAPIRAKVWDIWNQNIGLEQIDNDWFILTWSAKWLFDKKVYSARLRGDEAIKQEDKRILKGMWELLNEADVVVAHNGDKFDIPRLNTRFIINHLSPPLPYQSIDTLKTIKRQFAFTSNKLDFVNKMLRLERKQKHEGFPMWSKCYIGDDKALREMERYNVKDVKILEETYLRLRPWIKPHPNVGLFILDEHAFHCPSCGSTDLKDEGKKYYTTANAYSQFRCGNCGAVGRKRVSDIGIKQRRHLLLSVPK
jgi:DNA polymerase elongation subunit (family B)/predicted RNA-binding Zn-ribbon protein involved in translation (DUF1610 family)